MILNETTKKERFLDSLNKDIALCILEAAYTTYQSAKDPTLEVKRQKTIHGSSSHSFQAASLGLPG